MARRRRYYTRVKRSYRTRGGMGAFKPIVNGIIAEAGSSFASNFLGAYSRPVIYGAAGWFLKDTTLKTLCGIQLGGMLLGGGNGNLGGVIR